MVGPGMLYSLPLEEEDNELPACSQLLPQSQVFLKFRRRTGGIMIPPGESWCC